jgi:hypothetical protein
MAKPPAVSRDELIARVQAVAATLGSRRVSQSAFGRVARLSPDRAKTAFGTWNAFIRAAGLTPDMSRRRIADDDLLRALRDACVKAGGVVSLTWFKRHGTRGLGPYRDRWGTWHDVLVALRAWAVRAAPDFPYLDSLPQTGRRLPRSLASWPPADRRFGAPLNFRGLLHAPVNELGVLVLFGALAHDLGFGIESVTGSFPDCEAKRREGGTWRRVRVEVEYQSRNFLAHRHDPAACDLIVCWEHNWRECPLEVIELKEEVAKRA